LLLRALPSLVVAVLYWWG